VSKHFQGTPRDEIEKDVNMTVGGKKSRGMRQCDNVISRNQVLQISDLKRYLRLPHFPSIPLCYNILIYTASMFFPKRGCQTCKQRRVKVSIAGVLNKLLAYLFPPSAIESDQSVVSVNERRWPA
jgi:hypothetical protein